MNFHQTAISRIRNISRAGLALAFCKKKSNQIASFQIERYASSQPDHPFVLYGDRRYTYTEANSLINRYANAYKALGVKKGDVVALLMENRPEYYWHFFGLGKIGAISSLINTNSSGSILAYVLKICEPKAIVVGSELLSNFLTAREMIADFAEGVTEIDCDPELRVETDIPSFTDRISNSSERNPEESGSHLLSDISTYIYTSGTTGLPKASMIPHHRLYRASLVWGGMAYRFLPGDVIYICLPLYHSNGMILASCSAAYYGNTIALSRKFSTKHFWDDIRKYNATQFIYIGELLRYLINSPKSPHDREHRVRAITGNGLRPDIWNDFQERFGIKRISEFYASTEGNVQTINLFNIVGSVGNIRPGIALVRWNEETEDFFRRPNGKLIKCKANEPGIMIGRIFWFQEFDGYMDKKATEEKIIRNAFENGDAWFITGDILRRDFFGNLYFVDRVGDTFRFKGENVATLEVQEILSSYPSAQEVNVYGVEIDGVEGRVGMVALVLKEDKKFNPYEFKQTVDSNLPPYARPLFVRLRKKMDTTGTLKIKKVDLQKEGFDPSIVEDPLFFRYPSNDEYIELTEQLFQEIKSGKLEI